MENKELRIIPITLDLQWKNIPANIRAISDQVEARKRQLGDSPPIFVFPELTLCGFVLDHPEGLALEIESEPIREVREIAARNGCYIVFGWIEKNPEDAQRPFNTLLMVGPDRKILAHYRKSHLFTQGSPSEIDLYTSGTGPITTKVAGWTIGFGICFDLRFPDLFQSYRRMGVDLILASACWVDGPTKEDQFRALSAGQAVLTQAYFVSVNRSGMDPQFKFSGSHYAFAPTGQLLEMSPGGAYRLNAEPLEIARRVKIL